MGYRGPRLTPTTIVIKPETRRKMSALAKLQDRPVGEVWQEAAEEYLHSIDYEAAMAPKLVQKKR